MAVLVEGISVVIKISSIERTLGSLSVFRENVVNRTYCDDGYIARVGFLNPSDVESFVSSLEEFGLVYQIDDCAIDLVVCDQLHGLMVDADWLQIFRCKIGEGITICAAKLLGSPDNETVKVPDGWSFRDSLSENFKFIPDGRVDKLMFLQEQDGVSTHVDLQSG